MTECVTPYEEMKLNSKGNKLERAVHGRKQSLTVTAHQFATLEYDKNLGILWPLKLLKPEEYKKKRLVLLCVKHSTKHNNTNQKPDIGMHIINGQKIRGVMRSEEFGCPPGCYRLSQKSGSTTTMEGTLADTGDDLENDAETMFEAAQKR